jgi:hypothetical protein
MCYNPDVIKSSLSPKAREVVFQDAIQRDLPTARRAALLDLLWNERFLTRAQLIARVDQKLGKDCFGKSAWEDNFYRDMRIVKEAFRAAGFHLAYSRSKQRPGYYLLDQPPLSPELKQVLKSSASEADPRQIDIYHRLSPADRFSQGCAISDTARNAVSYRIRLENPRLSPAEANRLALQRAYSG